MGRGSARLSARPLLAEMHADRYGGNEESVSPLEPLEQFEPLEQRLFTTKDTKKTSCRLNRLNKGFSEETSRCLNRLNKGFSP